MGKGVGQLMESELWGLMGKTPDRIGLCYLAIDGLDGATVRDEVFRYFTKLSGCSPLPTLFFVVSRDEADIRSVFISRMNGSSLDRSLNTK